MPVSGPMRLVRAAVALIVLVVPTHPVVADVLDSNAAGFTVQTTVQIAAPAAAVYDALTGSVDKWWDEAHTWSGRAANLTIDPRPGGCFCEKLAGGGVQHMTVIFADRGKMLRMTGGLGPLQSLAVAGVMTFAFKESSGRTTLEATYAVLAYTKEDLTALAPLVDRVTAGQVARLKSIRRTPLSPPLLAQTRRAPGLAGSPSSFSAGFNGAARAARWPLRRTVVAAVRLAALRLLGGRGFARIFSAGASEDAGQRVVAFVAGVLVELVVGLLQTDHEGERLASRSSGSSTVIVQLM